MKQMVLLPSIKTNLQECNSFLNKFPKIVDNNASKFCLWEGRERPCLLTNPQTPMFSVIPEEVLTFATSGPLSL